MVIRMDIRKIDFKEYMLDIMQKENTNLLAAHIMLQHIILDELHKASDAIAEEITGVKR